MSQPQLDLDRSLAARAPSGHGSLRERLSVLIEGARAASVWAAAGALAGFERLTPRQRRGAAAGVAALFHLGLVIVALWTAMARPMGVAPSLLGGGNPANANGDVMSFQIVRLTAMATLGKLETAPPPAASPGGEAVPALTARASASPSEMEATDKAVSASNPANPSSADGAGRSRQIETAAASAGANGLPNLQAHIQGGDPDGSENILRQIARCLPAGLRPTIRTAHLHIELNADGQLRLAPMMQADGAYASRDALRAADRVVQAALQCGPYQTGMSAQLSFLLVPDFSFVDGARQSQASSR
jgi:hypothetical protein